MKEKFLTGAFLFFAVAIFAEENLSIPVLRIPKVSKAPLIDGQINQEEWSFMAALTGFRDFRNKLIIPHDLQPVWWIGYDDHYLYLAQKMPLYPRGTIKATVKQGDRGGIAQDVNSILYDDHVEIQFCTFPERYMALRNYFYKILTNPYGAIFDHRMEYSVGWFGFEWESSAKIKSCLTEDAWTFEMAIPFQSFSLPGAPPDGTIWYAQLVSAGDPGSYYYAWQPVAWTEWDRMPVIIFDSQAPAVQITSLGRPMEGVLDLSVQLKGKSNSPETIVSVRVTDQHSREIFSRQEKVKFTDATTRVMRFNEPKLAITAEGKIKWDYQNLKGNNIQVQVTGAGGEVIFQCEYPFAKSPASIKEELYDFIAASRSVSGQPVMKTCYYHTAQKIEGFVDVDILGINSEIRQAPRFRLKVVRASDRKILVSEEAYILPTGEGKILLATPYLEEGEYQAVIEILSQERKVLASQSDPFTIRSYPWEHTTAGKEEIVVKPFTPLIVKEKAVFPWGRRYSFGETGLLTSVVSQGSELLSGPVKLEATINGKNEVLQSLAWPCWEKVSGHNCFLKAKNRLGPLLVEVGANTEYDGTIFYRLDFTPVEKAVVEVMDLLLPLQGLDAYYIYRSGRDQIIGTVPEKTGVFWDSSRLAACPNIRGTFLPFACLTDGEKAFLWCADSDQGWVLDDSQPSFFLERQPEGPAMRIRLVNRVFRFTRPRTIEFMLQALPEKPYPEDYRYRIWQGWVKEFNNAPVVGSLSCFWAYGTGPTISFYRDEHYDVFKKLIDEKKAEARKNSEAATGEKFEPLAVWYVATNTAGLAMPEYDTYSGEWLGKTYQKPIPDPHYKDAKTPWGVWSHPRQQMRSYMDLVPSAVDCRVYAFDQQQKRCGLNGYWWDHDRFWSSGNLLSGTGYLRDDGSVQGIFNISLMRQMMKRMATCAELNGIRPWHGYYAPNNIGPISSFLQYNWGVESWVYMRSEKMDLLDNTGDLNGYKVLVGRYTGNPVELSSLTHEATRTIQTRCILGMAVLADVGVTQGRVDREEWKKLMSILRSFGYFDFSTEWIPWWRSNNFVQANTKSVAITAYRRKSPGKPAATLLVVFNADENPVRVSLEFSRSILGEKGISEVRDAETGKSFTLTEGRLTELEVKRRDYRLIIVE